ncbi:T9SS type A sorting domain-containing protein [Dokdonia ponticola]|uniref:T9SS type A sorting domain-containing protein n=1 Tax=Dokdonia ponticola TaxID=2041041 RepID=A0ABV9HXH4_9FLAO
MKKIMLITSLCTVAAFGQNPTKVSEYVNSGMNEQSFSIESVRSEISNINTSRAQAQNITLFSTRATFLENCGNGEFLTLEDFAGFTGGPNDSVEACSPIIDASGDNCFLEGEIQEGVVFTNSLADSGGNMVFFNESTTFGVDDPGVGADVFTAFTIINFTGDSPVTSVGFDLYSPLGDGGPIDARVFGETGLIETVTFDVGSTAFFVGIVSEEAIVSIELENLQGVIVELVTQFYFGSCEVLSVDDRMLSSFEFFPNPAQNEVRINAETAIQDITIFNLVGQKVATYFVNATASTIDISHLTTGAYIMQVSSNTNVGTFKLIKE